jgi:hypothetical protein
MATVRRHTRAARSVEPEKPGRRPATVFDDRILTSDALDQRPEQTPGAMHDDDEASRLASDVVEAVRRELHQSPEWKQVGR